MLDINYEDKNKFHMSLGIALWVAAAIIFYTNFWVIEDKMESIENLIVKNDSILYKKLSNGQSWFEFKLERLEWNVKILNWLAIFLLVAGSAFFFYGYVPWIIKH